MTLFQVIAHGIALGGAGAAQRIVAATGIGDNLQHRPVVAGAQDRPRGQKHVTLAANRVRHAVAFGNIIGIEKQRVRRLVAFQIGNTQRLPFRDLIQPVIAGFYGGMTDGIRRVARAFGQHEQAPSLR